MDVYFLSGFTMYRGITGLSNTCLERYDAAHMGIFKGFMCGFFIIYLFCLNNLCILNHLNA